MGAGASTGRSVRRRESADLLKRGNDNPLGPAYVGHVHAGLVPADPTDEPVPARSQIVGGRAS